jgi:hypothetical protein
MIKYIIIKSLYLIPKLVLKLNMNERNRKKYFVSLMAEAAILEDRYIKFIFL